MKDGAEFSYSMELFPTLNGNECTKNHMISLEKIIEIEKEIPGKKEEYRRLSEIPNPFVNQKDVPLYLCDMAISNFLVDYQGYLNPCHKCRFKKWNLLSDDFNIAWADYKLLLKEKASKNNKYNSQESAAENRSRTVRTKVFASILDDADGEKNIEEIDLPSEDYVLLNTIKEGVTEIREMDILTSEDKKYVKMILEDVDNINKKGKYSVSARKNILVSIITYYHILEKSIAYSLSDEILKDTKKKQMLGQYQFLCEYLETEPQNNIKNMDNDKLENIINDLTRQASDKAYRMYVEDTISNIMKEYGYDSVVSYNIGEDNKNSRIVFSNDNINICSSVSKDAVMIQVVGIGEEQPTKEEVQKQVEQQGALCSLYPQIKEKMEENNIHIVNESCTPVSEDTVMNISISKTHSKRKKKIYSTGFGRNADISMGFYEQHGRKVMHIDS